MSASMSTLYTTVHCPSSAKISTFPAMMYMNISTHLVASELQEMLLYALSLAC
jgi:hypothetical protein